MIEAKIQGQEPDFHEERPVEGVVDLMESLKASLEAIEKERFTPAADKRRQKGVVG